jgi:hypothetical protein
MSIINEKNWKFLNISLLPWWRLTVYIFLIMVKYIGIIITLILLIRFWIRIYNQVFSQLKFEFKWKSLLWWALLVIILALYDWIFDLLWLDKQIFYIRDVFTFNSVSIFLLYWLIVLLLITIFFRNLKNEKLLLQIWVAILSLVILSIFWWRFWFTVLMLYYILAAFTEEMFKFTVSNNQSECIFDKKVSLLLLLSLLIWLSFSISENIYSFVVQLLGWGISIWSILGRGLIASLIHCVSTWVIAIVLMKLKNWWLLFRYFIALLLWSLIHITYNLALVNNITWCVFVLVLFAFICLSYMFFNMDEIYNK